MLVTNSYLALPIGGAGWGVLVWDWQANRLRMFADDASGTSKVRDLLRDLHSCWLNFLETEVYSTQRVITYGPRSLVLERTVSITPARNHPSGLDRKPFSTLSGTSIQSR